MLREVDAIVVALWDAFVVTGFVVGDIDLFSAVASSEGVST